MIEESDLVTHSASFRARAHPCVVRVCLVRAPSVQRDVVVYPTRPTPASPLPLRPRRPSFLSSFTAIQSPFDPSFADAMQFARLRRLTTQSVPLDTGQALPCTSCSTQEVMNRVRTELDPNLCCLALSIISTMIVSILAGRTFTQSRCLTLCPRTVSHRHTTRGPHLRTVRVSHSSIICRSNPAPSCSGAVSPSYILTSSHCLAPSRCLAPSHCTCHAPSLGHVIFAVGNTIKSSPKVAHTTHHANSSPLNISVPPHPAQLGSSSLSLNLNPLVN
jgi:hypothetical protein